MRILMSVSLPVERFNSAVHDGSIVDKMRRLLETEKPEAAYFMEKSGERTAILIIDVADASEIPKFTEPWFLTFNARIELHPVMRMEDIAAANLDKLGKAWS